MITLPELSFAYDALEPHIDARTMEIHYSKHHAGYVKKANAALAGTAWEGKAACDILRNLDQMPAEKRNAIQNNVGGACNHSFFWSILTPNETLPHSELKNAIEAKWGSLEAFYDAFAAAAGTRFGSGWAWLVLKDGELEITSTANQDSPLSQGYTRVLGLDVWEHAYYLNYQNKRPDYIAAFWKVLNWNKANEYFTQGGV